MYIIVAYVYHCRATIDGGHNILEVFYYFLGTLDGLCKYNFQSETLSTYKSIYTFNPRNLC